MKKLTLIIIIAWLSPGISHAQIGKNFTAEIKALLEASIEKIKGAKDEKATTSAYQSTLPLTGFKVVLKESFGDYRVSCFYDESNGMLNEVTGAALMDTVATKISRLLYIKLDSKKQPEVLALNGGNTSVFKPVRKILLIDVAKNIKAEVILSDGKYPSLFITIYKFDRKLFKE